MKKRKRIDDILFLAPGTIIYVLFIIVPILICFYYSFTNWNGISPSYEIIGLKNFKNILTDESFWDAFKTTLIITVFSMIFLNVFGILIACWMDKKERVYKVCKGIIFIPCVLSSVVCSYMWSYMTQGNGGIINTFLGFFGIEPFDFFQNSFTTTLTVTVVISWAALGFYVTVYDATLKTISAELYEAAEVDGATVFQRFFSITLPMLAPGITTCTVLSLINGLRQYDFVKIMTPQSIETIAVHAVSKMTEYNMMGYASAMVLILFVFIVIVTFVQSVLLRKIEVEY